jgi:hypothetical protein
MTFCFIKFCHFTDQLSVGHCIENSEVHVLFRQRRAGQYSHETDQLNYLL